MQHQKEQEFELLIGRFTTQSLFQLFLMFINSSNQKKETEDRNQWKVSCHGGQFDSCRWLANDRGSLYSCVTEHLLVVKNYTLTIFLCMSNMHSINNQIRQSADILIRAISNICAFKAEKRNSRLFCILLDGVGRVRRLDGRMRH